MRYPKTKKTFILFVLIAFLCLLAGAGAFAATEKLPGYAADLSQTSVSGLSSGGFMTAQFHVAYSSSLIGAGIIAGGPYFCSGSYFSNTFMENATTTCMNPIGGMVPDSRKLFAKAKDFAKKGWIDPVENLSNDKVYIFSGSNDNTVKTKVVDQTEKFYELAGVPLKNINYVNTVAAGHAIITDNPDDVPCSETKAPYINDCDFVQARQILTHIYGQLNAPTKQLSGKIIKFDQSEFVDTERASMSKAAYLYVPASCEKETCRVHVAIHGCKQGAAVIKDEYYATTGYNEIADTNHMLVLYPQVEPSASSPTNPEGCWDFWGYSSPNPNEPNFYKKEAPQMKAIWRMLERLAQPRK